MIRVVIVDDQALIRTGFQMILDSEDGIEVVACCEDGLEAIEAAARWRPDVMLMDVRMPRLDGIEATRRILADNRSGDSSIPRILILTTFDLDEYVFDALQAGAAGFLLKDTPPETLVEGVRGIAAGDSLLSPTVTRRLIEQFATWPTPRSEPAELGSLTDRERDVLLHIAQGLSNAEIADTLYVGEATVKTHVSRLLAKLGLRDRVQAVVFAYESGLVVPGG